MKNYLFLLFMMGIFLQFANAQSDPSGPIQEIGISLQGFTNSNFGAVYKLGSQKVLWRNRLIYISGGKTLAQDSTSHSGGYSSFSVGLTTGIEFRKGDEFQWRYGFETGYRTFHSQSSYYTGGKSYHSSHNISLNAVLGINYVLKERWVFGAELLPGISYSQNKSWIIDDAGNRTDDSPIANIGYGLNSNSVLISIAYRLGV